MRKNENCAFHDVKRICDAAGYDLVADFLKQDE